MGDINAQEFTKRNMDPRVGGQDPARGRMENGAGRILRGSSSGGPRPWGAQEDRATRQGWPTENQKQKPARRWRTMRGLCRGEVGGWAGTQARELSLRRGSSKTGSTGCGCMYQSIAAIYQLCDLRRIDDPS